MVECFNELIRAGRPRPVFYHEILYVLALLGGDVSDVMKSSHGEEMYVFVRRYQKSLDTIRVNVRLSAATHS